MKNLSALFIFFTLFIFNINAQMTCSTALAISPGTQTVDEVVSGQVPNPECAENYGALRTGGRWYVFTASVDGVATVSSDLISSNNTDTRFHVYTGSCSSLTCLGGNDDIDVVGGKKTSEDTFPVTSGTTYYIAWDNRWSSSGFDFSLSETPINCPEGLPFTEDFEDPNMFFACYNLEDVDNNGTAYRHQLIDLDGDGTDNVYITNGSTSNIAKDDWIYSPPINLTNGAEYTFSFKYNGADGSYPANENLEVLLLDAPSSTAEVLTSLFYESGIVLNGNFSQAESMATTQEITYTATATGTYFLSFHATSEENTGSILLFDYSVSGGTLNVKDFESGAISSIYDKETDILTLSSTSSPIKSIEIYNLLGLQVLKHNLTSLNESINLNFLQDGVYLARVGLENRETTLKILKQ